MRLYKVASGGRRSALWPVPRGDLVAPQQLFLAGEWVSGVEPLASLNPSTGEELGRVSTATREQVSKAVELARAAQKPWGAAGVHERAAVIRRAAQKLYELAGEFGTETPLKQLMANEVGKPLSECDIEAIESADMLMYFAEEGKTALDGNIRTPSRQVFPDKLVLEVLEPLGVVGLIKPWNYPLELPVWALGAALLAGNAVVLKPSEHSPLVGLELAKLFEHAGLPAGVLSVLPGTGQVGEWLIDSGVDMISFTGSVATGREIARRCASQGTRCSLELGGNDAMIVTAKANLELAANGAVWGAFTNAGQVCVSVERVFVESSVYDEFLSRVTALCSGLRVGAAADYATDVGPLISMSQRDKVAGQVAAAIHAGATLLATANEPSDGFFFAPRVLTDISLDTALMQVETFGPVMPVVRVEDPLEAVSLANSTTFGLGASVWTTDLREAHMLSGMLDCGLVWINDVNVAFPQASWGGRRASGHGRELSLDAMTLYSAKKTICVGYEAGNRRDWWYPYGG